MLCWLILLIYFCLVIFREEKVWKLAVLVIQCWNCLLSAFSFSSQSWSCTQHQERSKVLQLWEIPYFIHIVHTGVPISFLWFYRVDKDGFNFSHCISAQYWQNWWHETVAIIPWFLPTTSAEKLLRRGRVEMLQGEITEPHGLGMVADKAWVNREYFQHILSRVTKFNVRIPGQGFHSVFSNGFVWSFSVHKGEGGWNLLSSGEFCRKKSFHSSGWFYRHNSTWFPGSTPSFSKVYIHQLMIHLEGSLLITQQRNKHHLCLPWSQNLVRIDLSLLISTKENWIVQNVLNRAIQNAEVKHQYKLGNSWKVFPISTYIYDQQKSR